ncbi:unnamed protein product, partial [Choristocarpus tenellus]
SDTDDTEADKENLRMLMLSLGGEEEDEVQQRLGEGEEKGEGNEWQDEGRHRNLQGASHTEPGAAALVFRGDDTGDDQVVMGLNASYDEGTREGPWNVTGEADAGGGNTLFLSSVKDQHQDISTHLHDISLQSLQVSE